MQFLPLLLSLSLGVATLVATPFLSGADPREVVACRQLPPGQGRIDCLERTSAALERELEDSAVPARSAAGAPRHKAFAVAASEAIDARVVKLSYADAAPVFELDNGQVWAAQDERRLTFRADGTDVVEIRPTPVGYLLHYNGSYYGLLVVRRR